MDKLVRLVAVDSCTLEPLYDTDENGYPSMQEEYIPLWKALDYQKKAYAFQKTIAPCFRDEFIIVE